APLSGVPVELGLTNPETGAHVVLASFTTDAQGSGSPAFTLPDWEGKAELTVRADTPAGPELVSQTLHLGRSSKLLLRSAKPVYQPGQTIRLRALALRKPDLHPVATRDVLFTVQDPRGNVIFKEKGTTSEFGIAAVDCPLGTEINEGNYNVRCKIGDTDS